MGINTCSWIMDNDEPCGERTEGNTQFCGSHNRQLRKEAENESKSLQKRAQLLSKPKQVRKRVSKNPKDWSNTFLCSDGTRVNESQVRNRLRRAYSRSAYNETIFCQGCGGLAEGHAHIVSKRRCKLKGRTELIWNSENYFPACNDCNTAIESHKGEAWKKLKNIDYCLRFIKQHDPELFSKFSAD